MGYLSIPNLYKPEAQQVLIFKQVYALEKIHGTSAHLVWAGDHIGFFSGGEKHTNFVRLFDEVDLEAKFKEKFDNLAFVYIYGEAYGGSQQKMSKTYGPDLKFVAFDVKINDSWLKVPDAAGFCESFGIEFVDYKLVSSDIVELDYERDRPSVQAERNSMGVDKLREGIVIRPIYEYTDSRGNRVIAKHKGAAFSEREKPVHKIDETGEKASEMLAAEAIADEWCTAMRLEHVIDHIIRERENKLVDMSDTKVIISEMIKDIEKEIEPPTILTGRQCKAVGNKTAKLLKAKLEASLREPGTI